MFDLAVYSAFIAANFLHFTRILGHTEAVTGLAFDPTGNNLASCSADMSAKIWDLATYICIKTLKV
jgi:WD40 repeat protein